MWEKIKSVFCIIGAVLSVAFFSVVCYLAGRRGSVGRGKSGTDELDSRITEGLDSSKERLEECRKSVGDADARVGDSEAKLRRAEEILRNAIDRSRDK